jgi:tRNA A37 threonylcarbamoyladenosine synthetase subunit TsaC/SUA5/YrdC
LTADLGSIPSTIGVRCPDHVVTRVLCRRVGPLATPSANLHGRATLPPPEAIDAELGDHVRVVLDAGPCTGAPSTVVDCTGPTPRLLREGRIPWADIETAVSEL